MGVEISFNALNEDHDLDTGVRNEEETSRKVLLLMMISVCIRTES